MRHVTDGLPERTYVRFMFPLPSDLAATLSTAETASLAVAAAGMVVLLAVRFFGGGDDVITQRPYGKLYSGAPGADSENKPDAR